MLASEQIEQSVRNRFADAVQESSEADGVPTVVVSPDVIVEVCEFLRDSPSLCFDYLTSLTAVDWIDRFEVVYHLYSISLKHRIVLKVSVDREDPTLDSTAGVWKAADWQEREVYDMFGIVFEGHPDLRRILTVEGFEGFPLRKDYSQK